MDHPVKWRELKAELLKNPDFKKEYDALEPEYRLLKTLIERASKWALPRLPWLHESEQHNPSSPASKAAGQTHPLPFSKN